MNSADRCSASLNTVLALQLSVDPENSTGTLAVTLTPTSWDAVGVIGARTIGEIWEVSRGPPITGFTS